MTTHESSASGAKILLIGDTSNRTNWGCRATSAALRSLIEERGATIIGALDTQAIDAPIPERVPITVLESSSDAEVGSSVGRLARRARSGLGRRLRGPVGAPRDATTLDAFADGLRPGTRLGHLAEAIERADVVIVNGEGAILQDRAVGRMMLAIAYTSQTRFSTPTAIVNHTAELRSGTRSLGEVVYPLMADVKVRERTSLASLQRLLGPVGLGFAADAAFSQIAAPETDRPRCSRATIVLGGSAAYHQAEPTFDRIEVFTELAVRLSALGDIVVTAASIPDDVFLEPVAQRLGLPYFGPRTALGDALAVLTSADLYVGGRWHPAILAARTGAPVVLFSSNSGHKSRGLLDLLSLSQPDISAHEVNTSIDVLVGLAEQRLATPDTNRLHRVARQLAESARDNVGILDGARG